MAGLAVPALAVGEAVGTPCLPVERSDGSRLVSLRPFDCCIDRLCHRAHDEGASSNNPLPGTAGRGGVQEGWEGEAGESHGTGDC